MIEGVARGRRPDTGTGSQDLSVPGYRPSTGTKGQWV